MKTAFEEQIYLCWRKCEHIAQSGFKEWRLDENGFPVCFGYYHRQDKQGGWFIKQDADRNLHVCSYDSVRTLL